MKSGMLASESILEGLWNESENDKTGFEPVSYEERYLTLTR